MNANSPILSALAAAVLSLSPVAHAQFTGCSNRGLVGAGRVSGEAFDAFGPNVDSMGGIGSSAFVDAGSVLRNGAAGIHLYDHPLHRS